MRVKINKGKVRQAVKRARAQAANRARSPWWKPKPGWNHVRVWAFKSSVTGEGEFYRIVWIHQGPNEKPQVCFASPSADGTTRPADDCDRCVEAEAVAQESGNKAANRYRSRERYAFLITPLKTGGEKEDKFDQIVLWQAAMTAGEGILDITDEADEVEDVSEYFGAEGLTIKFKYDPNQTGRGQYSGFAALPKSKSFTLDEALQGKANAMDLYSLPEMDPEWARPGAEDDEEDEKPKPKPKPDPVDDEDEDDDDVADIPDEDDEPEPEPKPKAKAKAKKKAAPKKAAAKKKAPGPDTEAYWKAKLKADGLDEAWDVEMHDGKPVFYPEDDEDADGRWEYPAAADDADESQEDEGDGSDEPGSKRRRGFAPRPPLVEGEDATES